MIFQCFLQFLALSFRAIDDRVGLGNVDLFEHEVYHGTPYAPCLERLMCWAMVEPADSKVACLVTFDNFAGAPAGPKGKICPKDSGTVGKGWRCRWSGEMVDLPNNIHPEHHHETEEFRVSQIFTRYSPPRLGCENGDFLLFQQIH